MEENKYQNCEIARDILANIYQKHDVIPLAVKYRMLNYEDKNDREFLKTGINELINILNDALKELGEDNSDGDHIPRID